MRENTHIGAPTAAFLAIALLLLTAPGATAATKHPSLVNPAKTKCATCHEELLENPVVHPPVADDCLSCHDFTKGDEGLTVALMASGSELCVMCHDGLESAAAGDLTAPHAPVMDDCSNCHDPHSSAEESLLTEPARAMCFGCHDADDTNAVHPLPVSRGDCRSCHDPHGSASEHMLISDNRHAPFAEGSCESCHRKPRGTRLRLVAEGGELCSACHGDVEDLFEGTVIHTAVRQGDCIGCHDPHMADEPKFLKRSGPELCFECHQGIEEAVTGDGAHAAVEDGCDGCHDPHASDHPFQLLETLPDLCLMCHDGDDAELRAKHLDADLTAVRCTECHDPHGSATGAMLASGSVHPPFEEACDTCHEGSASEVMEDGGAELCYACHDGVQEQVENAQVPHGALEMAGCIDCHSPHASGNPRLLRESGAGVCTTCHEDQAAGPGRVAHGTIDLFGCQSCHLPHGGDRPALLREVGNELCLGCHLNDRISPEDDGSIQLPWGFVMPSHDSARLRLIDLDSANMKDHPERNHPVAGLVGGRGRTKVAKSLIGEEISCRSCHDPHHGASRSLLAYDAATATELCVACHPR